MGFQGTSETFQGVISAISGSFSWRFVRIRWRFNRFSVSYNSIEGVRCVQCHFRGVPKGFQARFTGFLEPFKDVPRGFSGIQNWFQILMPQKSSILELYFPSREGRKKIFKGCFNEITEVSGAFRDITDQVRGNVPETPRTLRKRLRNASEICRKPSKTSWNAFVPPETVSLSLSDAP